MKGCIKCKQDKRLDEFNNVKRNKDGKHSYCRECQQSHYESNKERHAANVKAAREKYKSIVRTWKYNFLKETGCQWEGCDIHEPIMLEFDHIDRNNKEATICDMIRRSFPLERIMAEAKKCTVLCANHHRMRTAEQMGWTSFILYN